MTLIDKIINTLKIWWPENIPSEDYHKAASFIIMSERDVPSKRQSKSVSQTQEGLSIPESLLKVLKENDALSIKEIMSIMNLTQEHTIRDAMYRLRKRGLNIEAVKIEGLLRYSLKQ